MQSGGDRQLTAMGRGSINDVFSLIHKHIPIFSHSLLGISDPSLNQSQAWTNSNTMLICRLSSQGLSKPLTLLANLEEQTTMPIPWRIQPRHHQSTTKTSTLAGFLSQMSFWCMAGVDWVSCLSALHQGYCPSHQSIPWTADISHDCHRP